MRQLMYTGRRSVEWRDAPEPGPPRPGEAVVRPLAVARCDLELPMIRDDLFPGTFPLGHESVVEVVATGPGVERVVVGERALLPFQVSCGTCPPCLASHFAACTTYTARLGAMFGFGAAGGGHGGALTDLLTVPSADHMLIPAPRTVSAVSLATLSDNVVDAYRCVAPRLAALPGAEVLILGGGLASIGLYAAAIATALGSASVRYIDHDDQRCQAAESLGAVVTHRDGSWAKRLDPAPITVDACGDPAGLACALRSTAPYGHCTAASIYFEPATHIPLLEMYTRGITFHTSRADSRRHLPDVLELVQSGRFDPLSIPTTISPWDQADDAWLEPASKLIVVRDDA